MVALFLAVCAFSNHVGLGLAGKPKMTDDGNGNGTGNGTSEHPWKGTGVIFDTTKALKPVTDKVATRTCQTTHGRFLPPLPCQHQNPSMKLLEIGLECWV